MNLLPPHKYLAGGDFFVMIGRVIHAVHLIRVMIGGLFLGFFINGILIPVFAASGADLL